MNEKKDPGYIRLLPLSTNDFPSCECAKIFIENGFHRDGELLPGLLDMFNKSEGGRVEYYTTKYERVKKYRSEAIRIHGSKCEICGFDFGETYGHMGEDYIEVQIKDWTTADSNISWIPKYGYYWTLFRVYDENGVLIDEQCYGFANVC